MAGRVAECVAVWRGGGGSGPELLAGARGSPKALICLPRQPPLCSRAPDSQATTNTSSDAPVAQPRDRRVITAAAPDAGAPRGEGIVVSAAGQPLSGQAAGPAHCTPPAGASPMCSLGTSPHSEGPVAQVVWSLPGPLCPLILGWPLPGAAGGWLSPHPGNGLTPPPPIGRGAPDPGPVPPSPIQSRCPEAPGHCPGCGGSCSAPRLHRSMQFGTGRDSGLRTPAGLHLRPPWAEGAWWWEGGSSPLSALS